MVRSYSFRVNGAVLKLTSLQSMCQNRNGDSRTSRLLMATQCKYSNDIASQADMPVVCAHAMPSSQDFFKLVRLS
eukprot:scaffold244391_cov28-Prasinocladus_malaysianus.AAC.1